ncbi:MAG: thiolase domain-containing protein [Myxococcota bacterium]|nr:thiolase domain-containing protein [Myxococcota bacterium]
MRDVAIVSFAQLPSIRCEKEKNYIEMSVPVITEAIEKTGLSRREIDFTCSGSTDYLSGVPFSFVHAVDAIGAWPPISESHVEMDGAWALYEAWVKLQIEGYDTALVYAFGNSSTPNDLVDVLGTQMDPYCVAPLGLDSISAAALQARAVLDQTDFTERDFAEVAVRNRSAAKANPNAQVAGDFNVDAILDHPYIASPLRKHDCAPISDGAVAMVIATADVARKVCDRPVWIRGIDHRIEAHGLGVRDLTKSNSSAHAAHVAGAADDKLDVAEVYAPFTHQELILRDALGLDDDMSVNPSGGALAANPIMSAGLIRMGEVASRIWQGDADRGLAHATSGHCLQHNMVAVLEGE